MNLVEVIAYMQEHPYTKDMGARTVANRLHCDDSLVYEARKIIRVAERKRKDTGKIPRILLFDLETAPMRAYVWSRWKQNITLEKTISESFIICWSAKWLYENKVYSDTCTPEEMLNHDDKRICKSLWRLIDEANIVVAHNGKRADIPWMNSRFVVNGLLPTRPYQVVDTLEVARKNFGFSSNKLDALAGYFDIEHKIDTDFDLWRGCMDGNKDSLEYMTMYNQKDVKILEEVYLRLRPWIKGHQSLSVIMEQDVCPCCGSHAHEMVDGYYYTSVGKYRLYRCKNCGTVFRDRLGVKDYKPTKIALR